MPLNEQSKLALSCELREQILSQMPCGLCAAQRDERKTLLFANESFYNMFGYESPALAQGEGFFGAFDRIEPAFLPKLEENLQCLLSGQESALALETRHRRRDGSLFWAVVRISRAESGNGVWICAFMDISAQKKVEEELRFREEEYRIAVRQSEKFVLRYDIAKKIAYLPPETAAFVQKDELYDVPESLERNGVIGRDSLDPFRELYAQIVSGLPASGSAVLQMRLDKESAKYDWYRVSYSLIYHEDKTPAQAVISLQNVSEQHERELAYKRWEQTYAAMSQNKTAYIEFDLTQNRLELQKGGLIDRFPALAEQTMESAMHYFIDQWVHPEEREKLRVYAARDRLLASYFRGITPEKIEYRHLRENGRYGWVRLSVQMLPDPYSANVRAFVLLRDIDERKHEELNLQARLRADSLTGALNRNAFTTLADSVFGEGKPGGLHAFVMVDVDHFKQVNDCFGHGFGDRVLIRVVETLRSALRADDLVGRLGGDEFVVLLKNVAHREALLNKLEYLRKQLYQRISEDVAVSCSFGAAICPQDGMRFEELYKKADAALYEAKNAGRNCARIYEDGMCSPILVYDGAEL